MLTVAGGGWVLFGRDTTNSTTNAIRSKVSASTPANPFFGPVRAGTTPKPVTRTPTFVGPVAASKPAATPPPTATPAKAVVTTQAPVASQTPTKAPTFAPPPVTGPQRAGTVAKKDYTFKVARGETLWKLTKEVLRATGRSTSNANVAAHVYKLYAHNSGVVGSDPNLVLPGQMIVWPTGL